MDPQRLYFTVLLVQEFVGAIILLAFYWWLRRRQVKDPTLVWLSLSLLSWSVSAGATLIFWNASFKSLIPFIFSPLSSILFTMTAFQFSRVQEVVRRYELQKWRKFIIWSVTFLSFTGLFLALWGWVIGSDERSMNNPSIVGISFDATASCLALVALGAGLAYSFYKYGNQILICLTLFDITYIIGRQFDLVRRVSQGVTVVGDGAHAAFNIASYTTLTMLFIALAVAWSLSDASRLKRVGHSACVQVIVMFFDLRGSTQCFMQMAKEDHDYKVKFMEDLLEFALRHIAVLPQQHPHFIKPLGDGYMFIWEISDATTIPGDINTVAASACALHSNYPAWVVNSPHLWLGAPRSIGIGINFGSAQRDIFENGSVDYQGTTVDIAAKFQNLARPDGGVVIQANWRLSDELRDKFPVDGKMVIGNECIAVRATGGVRLQSSGKIKLAR